MLGQRIITAVILAVVFIGSILFASPDWVRMLFAVVLGAAAYELCSLTLKPNQSVTILLAVVFAAVFWWFGTHLDNRIHYYQSFVGALLWVAIFLYMPIYRFSGHWNGAVRAFYFVLGLALLWICVNDLLFIHGSSLQGGWVLLYLLTLVWIADIGAYFSGRRFGKNKLAPGISPGKTWEGVIGGIVANLAWMLLIYYFSDGWGMSLPWFIAIGLATSAVSVVGDLFESILKREAGVKDSGKLLPGHGGVLDRIDSVIAAAPVFVSGLYLAGIV
ncbi:MAG: phosphatidate cytidylyltransferase [Gammaproteobacteria bacterium]|nr:phosphatidate cytidylyltransferase [Gammaproteobacteria bacterium]